MTRLLVLALLISCGDREEAGEEAVTTETSSADRTVAFSEDKESDGLRFTLRSVSPPSEESEGARVATGTALSTEQVDRLLARTEALVEQGGDRKAFALRPASEPPPRTGATTLEAFPPPPTTADRPAPPPSGPLHVTRHAPDGDLAIVPHVMVSFDQPMIAVATQAQASSTVPVRLEPQPPGRWRWLGTQTLQFDPDGRSGEPEGRLPASTAYTVTVPAGTKSATGGTLAEAVSFSFRTPTVNVTQLWPQSGPQDLHPIVSITFDQAVDPEEVLGHARLEGGGDRVTLRLASDAEVESDPIAREWKAAAQEDRFVALAPKSDLSKATAYSIALTKGLHSLEGPRITEADQRFGFSTYAPLEIVSHECGWDKNCTPDMGWTIETNNPLDPESFDPATVTIDPPFEATIGASGNSIVIQGRKDGRKHYTVHVPATLRDTFGQTLGKAQDIGFDVGPANRTLYGPSAQMIVLDPGQKPAFPIWSTNHDALKVEIHRVAPDDWPAWQKFLRTWQYDDAKPGKRPGAVLRDDVVRVEKAPDRLVETDLDLGPWLQDGHGQFLVWVEPSDQPKNRWERQYAYAWVQVTDLGVTAFVDPDAAVVWTASLRSGDPVEGVELEMVRGQRATSGADGLAELVLPESVPTDSDGYTQQQLVIARKGSDVAILPESSSWYGGGSWVKQSQLDQLAWFVFDDRGMYRPKENVRVKGWLRRQEMRTHGGLAGLGDAAPSSIHWTLTSSTGNAMGEGDTKISRLGGFDVSFTIPDTANLGTAQLTLTAQGSSIAWTTWTHPIEIQEFRRPEFEVTATAPDGRWTLGEEATFTVDAHYYAGGGLAAADVSWDVTATPTSYAPPGHDGFTFGKWIPWWFAKRGGWWGGEEPSTSESLQATTDASGKHAVAAHFVSMNPPRPTTVRAEASVTDVNRQRWTSTASLLVHPSAVYVGLRTPKAFVNEGDRLDVDVLTVDPDGKELAADVAVRAVRNDWGFVRGAWIEVEKDAQDCTVAASTSIGHCKFEAKAGGRWTITATVRDDHGRKNETELSIWVSGGGAPPNRSLGREEVTLVPEKELMAPGETARLLVQAPFAPAEGTMTIERSGVVEQKRFHMDGASTTLEIPILEEHIPNVSVQVDLVGLQTRTDDKGDARADLAKRAAYAQGTITYEVSTLQRKLAVEVRPGASKLVPGGKTTIEVEVKDAANAGVRDAELAVVVVDDSVLALSNYQLPDPLTAFYAARSPETNTTDLREAIWLADPNAVTASTASGVGGGAVPRRAMGMMAMDAAAPAAERADFEPGMLAKMEESRVMPKAKNAMMMQAAPPMAPAPSPNGPPIAVRTNFDALALFAPEVRTDAKGHASVDLSLPDSLTRYRVMVVAVAGDKLFGAGESNVTARLPLMVRPSAPRFLQFGDSFELPIVLQNQTDAAMKVDVAVRATNVTFVDRVSDTLPDVPDAPYSQAGFRVTVPANDRVEVRFPTSTRMAGTARFQAVATASGAADAARFELPVWTPATTEAFATYGTTEGSAVVQPIAAPKDVWPQFGGLDVETSSTQLQALTDAVLYLEHYPYDCNEQIASRVLAIAALRDVLGAFESPELPPRAELEAQVGRDLERLHDRQNGDGGFAFWRRGDESWPYLGIYVAHAYAEAKSKGYAVPDDAWERSKRYLERIESHIPNWYSPEEKWFLRAYAVNVRWRMGDTDAREAKEILGASGSKRLSLEGHGFLLPVLFAAKETALVQQELQYLQNHSTETAGALSFGDAYEHGEYVLLASSRRADGVILSGLLTVSPQSDMVPKIVNGLLAHRTKGHWANTQEDTFILLALDEYFHAYEKTSPDFVARIWLGEGYAGEHAFRGRTTERSRIEIPTAYLTDPAETRDLVIDKQGAGRLYYRIAMRYAPRDLKLAPSDAGFYVQRAYEAINDPKDVRQEADGSWHIAAGSRVRVRLTMVAQARRYHVALVDPLPAGLEAQNPVLATTGTLPADPKESGNQPWWFWWTRTWYEHENLRDDRVEAFTSLLQEGAWEYTYVARATTPGHFVVPPTKAEEMYSPETFGRSGTDRVVIE